MKRLRRIIFNALAGLSLVLCLATVSLWVRSYGVPERIGYQAGEWSLALNSDSGKFAPWLWIYYPTGWPPPVTGWFWTRDYATYYENYVRWQHGGIGWGHRIVKAGGVAIGSVYVLVLPMWLVLTLLLAMPCAWLRRCIRRVRLSKVRQGFCGKCNYDLRATPERCPECGAIPVEVKT